jgi:hypothetical protein
MRSKLRDLPRGTIIVHGGAHGADRMAGELAHALGLEERVMLPDWDGRGRRAGIERNIAMLDLYPDRVLAFWDGASTGTGHTIHEARRRGIPVDVTLA